LKAVNLGSVTDPKWYAQEDLSIVPYQIYTSVVPTSLAESMLEVACLEPYDAAALVEIEALDALGLPRTTMHLTPLVSARSHRTRTPLTCISLIAWF
jgi:hypothetical protein